MNNQRTIKQEINSYFRLSKKFKGTSWEMAYYWLALGMDKMAVRLTGKGTAKPRSRKKNLLIF